MLHFLPQPLQLLARAMVADAMKTADLPTVPAAVVVRAATTKRVKARYTAGKVAQRISTLRRIAPADLFDSSLRKQMRLP
ncbi:MAG: hypothetical protein HC869_11240 [Rhodospirillales bacterium]|nr:hypothetical protein [Rhodospirillales bacterium]